MHRLVVVVLTAGMFAGAQERVVGVNFYSGEKESRLGAQLAAEVLRQSIVVDIPTRIQ